MRLIKEKNKDSKSFRFRCTDDNISNVWLTYGYFIGYNNDISYSISGYKINGVYFRKETRIKKVYKFNKYHL